MHDAAVSANTAALHAAYTEKLTQLGVEIERLKALLGSSNENIADVKREFNQLKDWVRALSYAQTQACRAIIVRLLLDEAPTLPGTNDESKPEEMARFIHLVNTYIDDVRETAAGARLLNHEEFAQRIQETDHSGDAAFREACRDQNLSTKDLERRRRYAIALEKLRITQNYLRNRGRAATTFQANALPNLLMAEDFDRARPRDEP